MGSKFKPNSYIFTFAPRFKLSYIYIVLLNAQKVKYKISHIPRPIIFPATIILLFFLLYVLTKSLFKRREKNMTKQQFGEAELRNAIRNAEKSGWTKADIIALVDEYFKPIEKQERVMQIEKDYNGNDLYAFGINGTCAWTLSESGTLRIYPENGISGQLEHDKFTYSSPWQNYAEDITKVIVENGVSTNNCLYLFCGLYNCQEMDLHGLDVSKAESLGMMFEYCESLEKLDISHFKFDNLYSVHCMCDGCTNLKEVILGDVYNFIKNDTFVKDESIFEDCPNLKPENIKEHAAPAFTPKVWTKEEVLIDDAKLNEFSRMVWDTVHNVEELKRFELLEISRLEDEKNFAYYDRFADIRNWEHRPLSRPCDITYDFLQIVLPPTHCWDDNKNIATRLIYPNNPELINIGDVYAPLDLKKLREDLCNMVDIRLGDIQGIHKNYSLEQNPFIRSPYISKNEPQDYEILKQELQDKDVKPWEPVLSKQTSQDKGIKSWKPDNSQKKKTWRGVLGFDKQ